MRLKFTFLVGFLCLFLVTTPALAIPMLSLDGGTLGTIPNGATNDILDDIYGSGVTTRDGYYGAQILLTGDANVTLPTSIEAGWSNDFYLIDDLLFNNKASTPESEKGPFLVSAGIIPFYFYINDIHVTLSNGNNPNNSATNSANFFVSFDGDSGATQGTSLVVFLMIQGPVRMIIMTTWRFASLYLQSGTRYEFHALHRFVRAGWDIEKEI